VTNQLLPTEIDAATAGPAFWARYHAYRRLRHAETRPEDPITPDDIQQAELIRENPHELRFRYEISDGNQMLSWFSAVATKPGTPEYDTNKHLLWANISVLQDHRRQGIGQSWIPLILEIMDRHSNTKLGIGTEEESGNAFLKWLGAEAKMTELESRVQLADIDWAMLQRWVDEGSQRSPATKLEVYDGRLPESIWEDYCPQLTSLMNTMPWEELDRGDIVITPEVMAEWSARMDLRNTSGHWMLTREPSRVISGITNMEYFPYSPTMVHQNFTGVRPDARGRGLGKWIKGAMAIHMRDLYPEAKLFVTANAGSNGPMLAINRAMGFRTSRETCEYQISRDDLVSRFQELRLAKSNT
jgi:GNAT superfamily N-acetyltransferase